MSKDKFILNECELEVIVYPNGEIALKKSYEDLLNYLTIDDSLRSIVDIDTAYNRLEWYNCSMDGVVVLNTIMKAIGDKLHRLYIDYVPYQRSDKDFFNTLPEGKVTTPLSFVSYFIRKLIPSNINIVVNDPHSENAGIFLEGNLHYKNVALLYRHAFHGEAHNEVVVLSDDTVFVYPDNTAYKRYHRYILELCDELAIDYNRIVIDKKRDVQSGRIISSIVNEDHTNIPSEIHIDNFIMIDDICDRGGTFISAKETVQKYLNDFNSIKYDKDKVWDLYVSHNTECEKHQDLLTMFNIRTK